MCSRAGADGDSTKLLGQFAALLVFLSVILCLPVLGFGKHLPGPPLIVMSWTMEHILIATTMLVVGLFAVLSWESGFPNRHDMFVLGPLPVRPRTILLAKIAAVAASLAVVVGTLNCFTGLLWPAVLNASAPSETMPAWTSQPALPPVLLDNLDAQLRRDLDTALTTGPLAPGGPAAITVGVWQNGSQRILTYGAAKPGTIYETGSLTKTFTALLLAQLAAEGKVRLDQPLRELLPPDARPRRAPDHEITLLDLATHRAAMNRFPTNFPLQNPAAYTDEDLYTYIRRRGLQRPERQVFSYSNGGYALLGQALANAAGKPWSTLVAERITGPLGMRDTIATAELTPDQAQRFPQGYDGNFRPVPSPAMGALAPAGAIRSTAADLLIFLAAHLHPERLTGPASALAAPIEATKEPRARSTVRGRDIALAWFPDSAKETWWHGGATKGFLADALIHRTRDYACIVLSNNGGGGHVVSADLVAEHVRARLDGAPAVAIEQVTVPARGSFLSFLRHLVAWWMTMLGAAAFIYAGILTLQGLTTAILPRRQLMRVSPVLQTAVLCTLIGGYFLQPLAAHQAALIAAQAPSGPMSWSPSFWFLGFFQQIAGSPALEVLAARAWVGLATAIAGATLSYVFCYYRTLSRIVEEPEIAPGHRGARWLPSFGTAAQTAIVHFSLRTLTRSRQHRLILAFYVGIALGLNSFFIQTPLSQRISGDNVADPWTEPSIPFLAATILLMGFWIMGTRTAFGLPFEPRANWTFQIMPLSAGPGTTAAFRRALILLAVAPVAALSALLLFAVWPWTGAAGHMFVLVLIGLILVELLLSGTPKLPFTCRALPGRSNVHLTFWLAINGIVVLVATFAEFERRTLAEPEQWAALVALLACVLLAARWRTRRLVREAGDRLEFEEDSPDRVLTLELDKFAAPGPLTAQNQTQTS